MYDQAMQTDSVQFLWKGQWYGVQQLTSVQAVFDETELLFEGWKVLCDRKGARADVDWDDYLQRVLAIAAGLYVGAIFIYYNKSKKPLGYTVVLEDTESRSRPTLFIYAGYSRGLTSDSGKMAIEFVCQWASANGYKAVRAQTRRINGAAMRYFRKVLGFSTLSVVFNKDL